MNTPLNTPNDTIVMIVSFFCTGLGCALALAGVLFWVMFFCSYADHTKTH